MRKLFVPNKEKTKAQAMVEFALVLPILLMLIYGLMEVGRLLFIYASTVSAARQAARYGSATGLSPSGEPYYQDCDGIESSANNLGFITRFEPVVIAYDSGVELVGTDLTPIDLAPANPACGAFTTAENGDRIKVTVETIWSPMTPLVPLNSFPISASSERTILVSVDIAVTGMPADFGGTGGIPSLSITTPATTYDTPGEEITFTYTITNIGDDSLIGTFSVGNGTGGVVDISCPGQPVSGRLDPGGTYICTGTYAVTQNDLDLGYLTITGEGSPIGSPSTNTTVPFTLYAIQNGELTLTKTASKKATITNVTYTYELENSGNVTLSSKQPPFTSALTLFTITDNKLGDVCHGGSHSDPDNAGSPTLGLTIAPKEKIYCTVTHTITAAEIAVGKIVNTATATAYYNRYDAGSNTYTMTKVEAFDEETVITTPIALFIAGTLNEGVAPYVNEQIVYAISVQNVGSTDVTLTGIAIPLGGFTGHGTQPTITCSGTIAAGATLTCPLVYYNVTQADLDSTALVSSGDPVTLTAIATATAGASNYSATQTESVDLYRVPALAVKTDTTVTVSGVPSTITTTIDGFLVTVAETTTPGSSVTYTYTIINTGNVTIYPPAGGFTVTDTQVTNEITCTLPNDAIAPNGTKICVSTREILQEDIDLGSVIGVTETSGVFASTTYTDTGKSMVLTSTTPRLTLEITSPVSSVIGAGVTISYSYILTNTGNADLSTTPDAKYYDFVETILKGTYPTNCSDATLSIGESTTCTGTYVTKSSDKGTDVVNTTSAYAYTAGGVQVHSNTATFVVAVTTPTYCSVSHGPLTIQTIGGVQTFGMTITNNNEYSIDVSAITITYNDVPNNQQITELTLGTGNVLWSKTNQSMGGSYTFALGVFTGSYTLAPGASNVMLYVSDWKTDYTPFPGGGEKIVVSFTDGSCPDLDSSIPSITPTADLQITKDDGVTSVDTNGTTTYTIRVTNDAASTSSITNAKIADAVASGMTKQTIACSGTPGVCTTAPSKIQLESGTFIIPTLAPGAFYEITVKVKITAGAGVPITNKADVILPFGAVDSNMVNNTASDLNTVANPAADMEVTKSNGVATVASGSTTTYVIRVTNYGPSTMLGVKLTDPLVNSGLSKTAPITCSSTPGKCVSAPSVSQLEAGYVIATLASGEFYEILVPVNVTATSGNVTNTASLTMPAGSSDPGPKLNTASDTDSVTSPVADLSITKSNGLSAVSSGASITYTIRVDNAGPSAVTGAILADPIAAGLSKTAVACSGTPGVCTGTISVSALEGGYALPTIGVGQYYEIQVQTTVTAVSGNVTNTATVAPPSGASDPTTPNTASDTDTVLNLVANLSISKSDGTNNVNTGGTVTYTIVVTNAGPSAANNAVFKDALVSGLGITSVACGSQVGGAVCPAAGSVTVGAMQGAGITIATFPSGGSLTFTVIGTVSQTSGTLTNTATITAPGTVTDPSIVNNTADDINTINKIANLSITKADSVTVMAAGSSTTYTIVVSNNGAAPALSPADGAIFKDPGITGLTVTDVTCASTSGGAVCPAVGATTIALMQGTGIVIPTLPYGGSVTFSVVGTATGAIASITNTATVTAPSGVSDPSVPNTASDTNTVNPAANLVITKDDGVATIGSGATTSYTIVVTNNGPSAANGAVFTDPLIAGLNVTGVTCTLPTGGAACPTVANTNVTAMRGAGIIIPTLPNGGSVTFTVTGAVTATSGSIINAASIATPGGTTDPTPINNTATDSDTVSLIANVAITKTDGKTEIASGKTLTYTVVVSNGGPSNANGAIFKDAGIAGLTIGSVTCGSALGGAVCPAVVNVGTMQGSGITIATLPDGGSLTFTVTGTVTAASGTLPNIATIAVPGGTTDPNLVNNSATDTDTVIGICSVPGLSSNAVAISGKDATWTITTASPIAAALNNLGVEVTWANAGSGSNWTLNTITLTNTSTLSTTGLASTVSPYTSGTGILKLGATQFTFTFSKNNPTGVSITITLQLPDATKCFIKKP